MVMTHHVLREAAAWSEQLSRAIYVIRLDGDTAWRLTPQLACPCCLLATVCGRQVIRWMATCSAPTTITICGSAEFSVHRAGATTI